MQIHETIRSGKFDFAFVLDAEGLRRVDAILRNAAGELEYTLHCSDGQQFTCESIAGVLQVGNKAGQRIKVLRIQSANGQQTPQIAIRFQNMPRLQRRYAALQYLLTGSQREAESLATELEQTLSGMRQWYSRSVHWDFIPIVAAFALAFALALLLVQALSGDTPDSMAVIIEIAEAALMLGGILLSGAVANRIWDGLFPVATFAIGDGLRRHKEVKLLRGIFLGLLPELLAGLVVVLVIRIF